MHGTLNLVGFLRSSSIEILRQFRQQRLAKYLLVFFVAACGYPERPRVIYVANLETFRPSSPREIKTVEQALAAIITVCRDDLKFPPVRTFEANLYKNSQSFSSYGVDWRMFPTDVAHMAAFAQETKIHVDLQKFNDDTGWATFTWLLAHEFGHTIHHEVSGVIPKTDAWFIEGFAEWVAAKVFDALGWEDYRYSIHRASKHTARQLDNLPNLSDLSDLQTWYRIMMANYGTVKTYSFGLVAVDRLLQRRNLASAIPLLSANAFAEALGGSVDALNQDIKSYLARHQSKSNLDEIVQAPHWQIGDKWTFRLRRPGLNSLVERVLIRTDTFIGIPSYVVKSEAGEAFYAMDSLALLAQMKNGEYEYRVSNVDQALSWPLRTGKEWRNNFTREIAGIKGTRTAQLTMTVSDFESVDVQAGRLKAVKIEGFGNQSGRLNVEYWYSPKAKWFAKLRKYDRDFSFIEEELVSFRVQ